MHQSVGLGSFPVNNGVQKVVEPVFWLSIWRGWTCLVRRKCSVKEIVADRSSEKEMKSNLDFFFCY